MNNRGATFVEVLVAASLMLLVMGFAFTCLDYFYRTGYASRADVEPRGQMRSLFLNLSRDVRNSGYVFQGYTGPMLGREVSLPSPGGEGSDLVVAIPENHELGSLKYTVCAIFTQPRDPADPNNPQAEEVVYYRQVGLVPPEPDTPASIDLATLGGGTRKTFDTYISPGAFRVQLSPDGRTVTVLARFQRKPERGSTQSGGLETTLTLRNIL